MWYFYSADFSNHLFPFKSAVINNIALSAAALARDTDRHVWNETRTNNFLTPFRIRASFEHPVSRISVSRCNLDAAYRFCSSVASHNTTVEPLGLEYENGGGYYGTFLTAAGNHSR